MFDLAIVATSLPRAIKGFKRLCPVPFLDSAPLELQN